MLLRGTTRDGCVSLPTNDESMAGVVGQVRLADWPWRSPRAGVDEAAAFPGDQADTSSPGAEMHTVSANDNGPWLDGGPCGKEVYREGGPCGGGWLVAISGPTEGEVGIQEYSH